MLLFQWFLIALSVLGSGQQSAQHDENASDAHERDAHKMKHAEQR
jgi:hypothetical protein